MRVQSCLTLRDIELFKNLSTYGMLSTKQVTILVFNSIAITTVLRRLRLLEASFYVKRILGLESQDVLWVLTEKGASMAGVNVPKRKWSKNMLEHDFKLLSLRLALEGCGVSQSWIPEHEIRSLIFKTHGIRNAKQKIIPDGIMSIEVNGVKESVSIELELTMKNSRRYQETFRRYHGKDDVHAIWYLVPSKGIMNLVYRSWRRAKDFNRLPNLYLSYVDEVFKDPLEARLFGEKPPHLIKDIWFKKSIPVPAHPHAQGVSTLEEDLEIEKSESTTDDHSVIINEAS